MLLLVFFCALFTAFEVGALTSLVVDIAGDTNAATGGTIGLTGDLRGVLNYANEHPADYAITFSGAGVGTNTLQGILPILNFPDASHIITIDGANAVTIDGGGVYPGFLIVTGTITLENFTISNCASTGGNGGSGYPGGDGGSGVGAAVLLYGGSLILENMTLSNSSCVGGNLGTNLGGNGGPGGGGGGTFGGNGGNASVAMGAGGGGGGYGASGGSATVLGEGGGGGGLAPGGAGGNSDTAGTGGSAYGFASNGGAGQGGAAGGALGGGGGGAGVNPGGGGGGGPGGGAGSGGHGGAGADAVGGGGGGGTGGAGGTGADFGGGGGAGYGSSSKGTSVYGGDGGPGLGTGGPAYGAGLFLKSGSLTIQGQGEISGSTLTAGSPTPASPSVNGWSICDQNANLTITMNPSSGETITITESFILGNYTQNGPGTVSIQYNSSTPPVITGSSPPFTVSPQPAFYTVETNVSIEQGTLNFQGSRFQYLINGYTYEIYTPDLTVNNGNFTLQSGTTLSGTGALNVSNGVFTAQSGSTISISPGTFFLGGNLTFNSGSTIDVTVTPTSASLLITGDSSGLNLSQSNLDITVSSGSYPTTPSVYTLVVGTSDFQNGTFNEVTVNGSSGEVYFSPPNAPNAVFYPINVPYGLSSATIYFGVDTLQSFVLFDPCAGLIIVDLLLPGEASVALSDFFANQCSFTLQALGSVTTSVNQQIVQQKKTAGGTGAIAAWHRAKDLLVQAEPVKQAPKKNPFIFSAMQQTPLFSISANAFGQFQHQAAVTLNAASLSAYGTSSQGLILGIDYLGLDTTLVGGAISYIYSDLNQPAKSGTQKTDTFLGTFYTGLLFDQLSLDLLITGGYNRNLGRRNSPGIPSATKTFPGTPYSYTTLGIPASSSKSSYDSYQLTPHFDLNYEIGFDWISLLPFIQSDCVITFEKAFQETGGGFFEFSSCGKVYDFNNAVGSLLTFFLQSEVGVNLFEQLELGNKGAFVFRQKASYVNRYTFPYILQLRFLSQTSFTDLLIDLPMQHFFGSSAEMVYRMKTTSIIFTYENLIGSGYMSNAVFLRFAQDF